MTGIKENFKEGVDNNQIVKITKDKIKQFNKLNNSQVIEYMTEHFPGFNEEEFEQELMYIFEESYNAYLRHDLETVEKHCNLEGLAFYKSKMFVEEEKGGVQKYQNIFGINTPVLVSQMMVDKVPLFTFQIKFYDITCLVKQSDPETIIEGDQYKKNYNELIFWVVP